MPCAVCSRTSPNATAASGKRDHCGWAAIAPRSGWKCLFWDTLEEIAAKEGMSLAKFLTTLHDEVLDHHGEVKNFASLLRCSCMIYRAKKRGRRTGIPCAAAPPTLDAAE